MLKSCDLIVLLNLYVFFSQQLVSQL